MFYFANLKKMPRLPASVPEAMQSFKAFDKAVLEDGVFSKKHKELIAVALALTTQ